LRFGNKKHTKGILTYREMKKNQEKASNT